MFGYCLDHRRDTALDAEREAVRACQGTPDRAEGGMAFLQKREPVFEKILILMRNREGLAMSADTATSGEQDRCLQPIAGVESLREVENQIRLCQPSSCWPKALRPAGGLDGCGKAEV